MSKKYTYLILIISFMCFCTSLSLKRNGISKIVLTAFIYREGEDRIIRTIEIQNLEDINILVNIVGKENSPKYVSMKQGFLEYYTADHKIVQKIAFKLSRDCVYIKSFGNVYKCKKMVPNSKDVLLKYYNQLNY